MARNDALALRFLGEIALERGGQPLSLPQSKKTRALLAYLVLNPRSQRRDRLCSLFWDIADDPRGALRWSLSRLRPLVDSPQRLRLVTDRDHVSFNCDGVWVDTHVLREQLGTLGQSPSLKTLESVANLFRGDFLEGLELPDFDEFQAWCTAEREQNRILRAEVLSRIVDGHSSNAAAAVPFARTLVQIDPLNESAHASLVRLLLKLGREKEARRQFESGTRLLKEAGVGTPALLNQEWHSHKPVAATVSDSRSAVPLSAIRRPEDPGKPGIVGRRKEIRSLTGTLRETRRLRQSSVVLLGGEPGIGKSRLLAEVLGMAAAELDATVIAGRAFEAESSRPYGPWIEALRKLPAVTVGSTIAKDLASLVPELSPQSTSPQTRDQLFGAVVELIAARAHTSGLVVLAMDDVQWCDDASAELLHYVVRSNRHRPLLVLLAARIGELPDNTSMVRVLRSMRRESGLEQITLEPLSLEDSRELAGQVDPRLKNLRSLADTSGNPLFVLELARSCRTQQEEVFSQNMVELVRDRVERLAPPAPDILRWGAVLGATFTADAISNLSGLEIDSMMRALETLERDGLIRGTATDAEAGASYSFSHDVVRKIIYSTISEPRRRIFHGRVAALLSRLQEHNESITPDVVQHAALAGDAAVAARACVSAGKRCLRLFANLQAETFAKRGLRFAERLADPERVILAIELTHISMSAKRPDQLETEAEQVEQLAERALDHGCLAHARLAFHISSYLRWEGGDWSVAERDTLRAELVSRTGEGKERLVALAEAARCLAMLERDLGRASNLLMEAAQLAERTGLEAIAIPLAEGLIHEHEGRYAHATRCYSHALELARRDRDRENEFSAVEHLVMIRIDENNYAEAHTLARQLVEISGKVREGSEAPFAKVLEAICGYALDQSTEEHVGLTLAELQSYDAKHRLAFAMSRVANIYLKRGLIDLAERYSAEALRMAEILKRPSEIALARSILGRTMFSRMQVEEGHRLAKELAGMETRNLSSHARTAVDSFLEEVDLRREASTYGNRGRRKNIRTAR